MFYFIAQAATETASTAEKTFVACNGLDCSVCKLIETVVNILSWLLTVSFYVAVLFAVIGGFIYIGSRGNEVWMSQAKRTILWAVGGFAIVLLANLAVRVTLQVAGATNKGILDKFDCNDGSSTGAQAVPEQKASTIAKSAKSGGVLSGNLAKGSNANDILNLVNNLDPSDIAIFESVLNGQRKPIIAVGKTNNQAEIVYVDRPTINQIFQTDKKASWLMNEAYAQDSTTNSAISDLLAEVSQIIARLIQNNHDLFVVITDKPNNIVAGAVGTIVKIASDVNQCVETGGYWYRFSDICKAEQEKCSATKCTSSQNSPVSGCKCPNDKCLSGGQCMKSTAKNNDLTSSDTNANDNITSPTTNGYTLENCQKLMSICLAATMQLPPETEKMCAICMPMINK